MDDNDNSIVTNAVHTSGSNSQALAVFLSQYASQSNRLSTHQKKESPLGAAIKVAMDTALWRSFECRKDCLFGKHYVEVQSKHTLEENTCMMSSKDNRVSIPPKRFRIGLSDDGDCDLSQDTKNLVHNFQTLG